MSQCRREDCSWPSCVGPVGCQATPNVLASIVVDTSVTAALPPIKTGRTIWKDQMKKRALVRKRARRDGTSTQVSVSVAGKTYWEFKEVTQKRGLKMGSTLAREIIRFLDENE